MNFKECELHLDTLFAAHARNLTNRILESWWRDLESYAADDLGQVVRQFKLADRLPTLGEIVRALRKLDQVAQARAEAQARHAEPVAGPSRFGKIASELVRRLVSTSVHARLDYPRACRYLKILIERYQIMTPFPLTGHLADDHEIAAEYKRLRWRQDMAALGGLAQVGPARYKVRS